MPSYKTVAFFKGTRHITRMFDLGITRQLKIIVWLALNLPHPGEVSDNLCSLQGAWPDVLRSRGKVSFERHIGSFDILKFQRHGGDFVGHPVTELHKIGICT